MCFNFFFFIFLPFKRFVFLSIACGFVYFRYFVYSKIVIDDKMCHIVYIGAWNVYSVRNACTCKTTKYKLNFVYSWMCVCVCLSYENSEQINVFKVWKSFFLFLVSVNVYSNSRYVCHFVCFITFSLVVVAPSGTPNRFITIFEFSIGQSSVAMNLLNKYWKSTDRSENQWRERRRKSFKSKSHLCIHIDTKTSKR